VCFSKNSQDWRKIEQQSTVNKYDCGVIFQNYKLEQYSTVVDSAEKGVLTI
jgi:ABC-type lipoprotein export system ATPase subunit